MLDHIRFACERIWAKKFARIERTWNTRIRYLHPDLTQQAEHPLADLLIERD